jgi:toxin ParE1/3/4
MDIAAYTLDTWGPEQAVRYVDALEDCCRRLANKPDLGRPCGHIRPGLRRIESGRHVVFYRVEAAGIVVSRILHHRMLPDQQTIDDVL